MSAFVLFDIDAILNDFVGPQLGSGHLLSGGHGEHGAKS